MGNETAAAKRHTAGRRGDTVGRQVVGNYTDQPAGNAAQAVRCAGLRPGLQRTFGCDASLLGLVVSQDPPAGSELARNGLVMLHVAASGTASSIASAPAVPTPQRAPADRELGGSGGERREPPSTARRRKSGLSGRAPEAAQAVPPLPPATQLDPQGVDAEREREELIDAEQAQADDRNGAELSEDGFDGLTREEFVVHVDDLFAGRWRSARRAQRVREATVDLLGGLRAHPWLAGSGALAIGVWILLALGALAGQHPVPGRTTRAGVSARAPIGHTHHADRELHGSATPPRGPRAEHHMKVRRSVLRARRARIGTWPARARPVARATVPSATVDQPTETPSTPAHLSEPTPPPPAEQTTGGPFSP